MRANRRWLVALAALWLGAGGAHAQDDVPRAPRLPVPGGEPELPGVEPPREVALTPPGRPPNAARLAPLPEQRGDGDTPDEIVVVGRAFGLPDLGSRWRAQQEEQQASGRFRMTWLPFYDPERPPLYTDPLLLGREAQRHGYIELFRLRFGRGSDD